MHVALIHDASLPARTYGGTERVLWWLAKGLFSKGAKVTLLAPPGGYFPFGDHIHYDFKCSADKYFPIADVYHFSSTPKWVPSRPYVVTVHGNGGANEVFLPNSVFVSRDHARRHHAETMVHHGLDPEDYRFERHKGDALLFLAKASWRVKNVKGAIRMARKAGVPLDIVGGGRGWLPSWRGTRWHGMLGGERKAEFLARARGLLFPILWREPFGLAVIEALVSGAPVIASRRGSMPELLCNEVGILCDTELEFVKGIHELSTFKADRCREWATEKFHYLRMVTSYLELYERVLSGEPLQSSEPFCVENQGMVFPLALPGEIDSGLLAGIPV